MSGSNYVACVQCGHRRGLHDSGHGDCAHASGPDGQGEYDCECDRFRAPDDVDAATIATLRAELAVARAETAHQHERAEAFRQTLARAEPMREEREAVIEALRARLAWYEDDGKAGGDV